MRVIGSWLRPVPARTLRSTAPGLLDLGALIVVVAGQRGLHAVENVLVGR